MAPTLFIKAATFETHFVHCENKVALIAEEASKYLAKAYNLSKDEVTFGLPLSDVRGTRLSTLCQIKVDFPCQPGKYRAYNGYCNNVQNPNWGKMSSKKFCYCVFCLQDLICFIDTFQFSNVGPKTRCFLPG